MDKDKYLVRASWIITIGTIIAALGATPVIVGKENDSNEDNDDDGSDEFEKENSKNNEDNKDNADGKESDEEDSDSGINDALADGLAFVGNTLQAVGNIMGYSVSEHIGIDASGQLIQASGNVTVLFAQLQQENTEIELELLGNSLQAFGGLISGLKQLYDGVYLNALGNFLQSIGNTLQAIGAIDLLNDEDDFGNFLIYIGSWIQSGGAIICTASAMEEYKEKKMEEYSGYGFHPNKKK